MPIADRATPASKPAAPPQPAAKSGASAKPSGPQANLNGAQTYDQGRAAVKPPALPGLGATDPVAMAQQSVVGGSVGATLNEATSVSKDGDIEVLFDAGSRLEASLGYGGLRFDSNPGILVKVRNGPDVRINSVRWSFDEARFHADVSSDGFDLMGVIGRVGRWKVEQVLMQKLKPLLPPAVQQAGYSPQTDPQLSATIGQMQKMFAFSGGAAASGDGMAGKLSAPSASLDVSMPQPFVAPLGTTGLELTIAQGTPIDLAAQGAGKAAKPTIESLSLRAGAKGIQVRPTAGMFKEFKELDLHGVTIRRGGAFDFDYDLSAEGAIQGLFALGQLLGLAAGQPVSGNVPDVKLDAVRAEIDAKLQAEVPPRFKAFLQQYDGLVPGFSLKSLFGA